MTNLLLVAVIGLPGSGKSTLCSLLASHLERFASTIIICYDSLIPVSAFQLDTTTKTTNWHTWRKAIMHCVERLILHWYNYPLDKGPVSQEIDIVWGKIHPENLDQSRDLIILLDDNFYYTSMRRPLFCLAKQHNCSFATVECFCPLSFCLQRNAQRSVCVEEQILIEMVKKFEAPNAVLNHWEKHTFRMDSSSPWTVEKINALIQHLMNALREPFSSVAEDELSQQKSRDRQINLESVLHATDNILRGHVRSLLQSKDVAWRKAYGKIIGKIKSQTLNDFRSLISAVNKEDELFPADYPSIAVKLFDEKVSNLIHL